MNKKFTAVGVLLLVFQLLYAQEKENPFSFEASYIGDGVTNLHGGIKTGAAYLGMGNISISFDTEKANWWKGGKLFVNGANIHGNSPTEKLVGDFQGVSNIDGGEHTYMQEFWYKQSFKTVWFSFGLQDLNTNFSIIENGGDYINSSFGISSLISTNITAPIFPLTSLGLKINWHISKNISWRTAIFDGTPNDFEHNKYNLDWRWKKECGLLGISEFHFANPFKFADGLYKIGTYQHGKPNETDPEKSDYNYGFYVIADQDVKVWNDDKKLSAFAQFAVSPQKINSHNYYLCGGLNYYGLFNRTDDVCGVAFSLAGFHNKMYTGMNHRHETVIETFYRVQFSENFALQPDIQYVINPSGSNEYLKNVLVGILRLHINF